jgi:hypothetical protein
MDISAPSTVTSLDWQGYPDVSSPQGGISAPLHYRVHLGACYSFYIVAVALCFWRRQIHPGGPPVVCSRAWAYLGVTGFWPMVLYVLVRALGPKTFWKGL